MKTEVNRSFAKWRGAKPSISGEKNIDRRIERKRNAKTKVDKKKRDFPFLFPFSYFHTPYSISFFRSVEMYVPRRHDTPACIIIFLPRLSFHPRKWQPSRMFFLRFALIPSSFAVALLLPLSPWKPCGSYTTFGRGRYQEWWRVRGEDGGESTRIRSRNVTWMQYLKAAQRQYSLSSLPAFLAVSTLLRSSRPFEAEKRRLP